MSSPLRRLFVAVFLIQFAATCWSTSSRASAQDQPDVTTTSPASAAAFAMQFAEPVVARVEMKLTLNDKVIDTIEKGDLLTVTAEREDSYVIRTFSGNKGAVCQSKCFKAG